jgi:hypothetical protein
MQPNKNSRDMRAFPKERSVHGLRRRATGSAIPPETGYSPPVIGRSALLLLLAACVAGPRPADIEPADGDRDGVPDAEDCAPADATIPAATDGCNGVDDDCDGETDEDAAFVAWYDDADGDGAGDPAVVVEGCAVPAGYVAGAGDCDPADGTAYPGAEELCDLVDQDCDGDLTDVDPALGLTWYRDVDGDGYGDDALAVAACFAPEGYVSAAADCDDAAPDVNPGAAELCDDADLDEDCDGLADDADEWVAGGSAWFTDFDRDGFGVELVWRCGPGFRLAEQSGDCDDGNVRIWPGAPESCGDGVDGDCDGEDPPC